MNESNTPNQIAFNFGPVNGNVERQEIHCTPSPTTSKEEKSAPSVRKFRIRKGQKTNFVKVIYALYKLNMFEDEKGLYASNKQLLFNEFEKVFDTGFANVDQILYDAKQTKNFLDVFEQMREKMEEYDER